MSKSCEIPNFIPPTLHRIRLLRVPPRDTERGMYRPLHITRLPSVLHTLGTLPSFAVPGYGGICNVRTGGSSGTWQADGSERSLSEPTGASSADNISGEVPPPCYFFFLFFSPLCTHRISIFGNVESCECFFFFFFFFSSSLFKVAGLSLKELFHPTTGNRFSQSLEHNHILDSSFFFLRKVPISRGKTGLLRSNCEV